MRYGIIVDHTAFSELNGDIVNEIQKLAVSSKDDICLFSDNISNRIVEFKCAVLDTASCPSFTQGILIATNLSTAITLKKLAVAAKKVFYVWDPEWIYKNVSFDDLHGVLSDENIHCMCRHLNHCRIVENLCGINPSLLEKFSLENINEIC
jgi:hypothetical protein